MSALPAESGAYRDVRDAPPLVLADMAAMNAEALRCTVDVTPLAATFQPVAAWTFDSYALPVPAVAVPYVRDAADWRRTVHAAIARYTTSAIPAAERRRTRREYADFLWDLMYLGPGHDRVGRRVLRLFPPRPCADPACGNLALATGKATYCSDDCRRAMGLEMERRRRASGLPAPTKARRESCLVCAGALPPRRLAYCSDDCYTAEKNRRRHPVAAQGRAARDGR